MVRNYRLRFVLLVILLALVLTTPVRGDPGPFGKITPTDDAEHQPLKPTLSWGESEGAVGYEYCYDMTDNDLCEGTWIPAGTVALPPSGLVYNTTYYWQARAIDAGNVITYADDGVWWSFTTQNPPLAVDKALTAQSTTPIALGTVLTYTVTATNAGDVTLSNVAVSDPLLAPVGGTTPCATLAVGANCTLVGVYTVMQADVDAGVIVNTGSAVSDEVTVAVTATVSTSIPQNPALAVDKALTAQSTTPVALGTVLTYTITATNAGNVTLHNVVVNDTLVTPDTMNCASVAPGDTCELVGSYTVTQADVDAGAILNTGTADSDETGPATDDEMVLLDQAPQLSLDKVLTGQSSTPIAVGTVLTYTVTATNAGNVTLSNVVVSDALLTPSSISYSLMPPDAIGVLTGSYEVQEADFLAGAIVNTATATADDPNGDPLTPATDTVTTPLVAAPPLANPDASLGNPIGQAVTVDVLANDLRGDLPIDPTSVVIVGAPGDGKFLEVPDEGYWLVNSTTGTIIFVPATGFAGDPTPITYTVADVQGNTSNAATVTIAYTSPPEANDDASLGNPVGSAVIVDVLYNDTAAEGRTLAPTSVRIVGADAGSDGKTLTVSGEGVWTVDTDSGEITFTPEVGFEGNPAAIQYTVSDDQGNTSNPATVVVSYTNNPLARNDTSLGNPVGSTVIVDVLDNDVPAPNRTLEPASVQISGTTNPGDSLVVVGQGTWSVNTTTGEITFAPEEGFDHNPTPIAYTMADDQGNVSNAATVTVTYTAPPVAVDDVSLGNPVGSTVTVAVLANDAAAASRTLDPTSVQISGTTNPGDSLVIAGQGAWSVYTTTGAITFTPEPSLAGDPTPISYTVNDDQGNISNAATVTVTYTDPPVANDDQSLGNPVGSTVTVDVLLNDTAAVSRTLDPAAVQISGTTNPGDSLLVAGQGAWSVYTITGAITFTPEANLAGNPTPISYTVNDDQGNVSNAATVTVTYAVPPVAVDDASLGNPVGQPVTVDVLANDTVTDRPLDPASVQISGTTNPGDDLVVAGQGTWSVSTTTGAITFTPEVGFEGNPAAIQYTVSDDQGNTSNPATVVVSYTDKGFLVYLPFTVRHWPPIPPTPVLNAISNPDGDGNYIVSWNSTQYATSYVLQESKTASFSDAVQVYSDTGTMVSLSDRGPTRYYYRVQAHNIYVDSAWSNVRSVDVVWEKEPNDDALTQANGPLAPELTYYGSFPSGADRQDYYFINLQSAQNVELWLSNIAAGQDYDLTLRNSALQVVGHSGELGNANEHIRTVTLPAGLYYIQVYNRSGGGSTQVYHLRTSYSAVVHTALNKPF